MAVPESTRRQLEYHLSQAEFALKVASNFECLKSLHAHQHVRDALAQVAAAKTSVRENLRVERPPVTKEFPPLGHGLPLTRKERMGFQWP